MADSSQLTQGKTALSINYRGSGLCRTTSIQQESQGERGFKKKKTFKIRALSE